MLFVSLKNSHAVYVSIEEDDKQQMGNIKEKTYVGAEAISHL